MRDHAPEEQAAIRGASAMSIAAQLMGVGKQTGAYPLDADDFGRCEALLTEHPQLRADLLRMAALNAYWAALAPRWTEIAAATDKTALIKSIIGPVESADPGHVLLRAGMSMRVGGVIDFKGEIPMKNTDADLAVKEKALRGNADELRQFIERIEQMEAEKADIAGQIKEIFAEIKGRGFDSKAIRKIVSLRKQDDDKRQEDDAILGLYMSALGMS